MDLNDAKAKYRALGLETRYIVDEPNETSAAHRHASVYLFTVKGSTAIKLDGQDWQTLLPGQEVRIADNQLHEAITGPEGWEYLFAASPEEVKRQGL